MHDRVDTLCLIAVYRPARRSQINRFVAIFHGIGCWRRMRRRKHVARPQAHTQLLQRITTLHDGVLRQVAGGAGGSCWRVRRVETPQQALHLGRDRWTTSQPRSAVRCSHYACIRRLLCLTWPESHRRLALSNAPFSRMQGACTASLCMIRESMWSTRRVTDAACTSA